MNPRSIPLAALAVTAAVGVAACGSSSNNSSASNSSSSSSSTGSASSLSGAGSTLVAPLVSVWDPLYQKANGVTVTYGATGSGAGIVAITGRSVDFGASDAPLTTAQATACKSCLEIPWALAATAVAYNVKGVPNNLKLTGPVLAEMFLGTIKTWNDPQIAKLNPGVSLPSTAVVPVHRTDGSGDTYAFTNYLGQVSPTFKAKIGAAATTVAFPGGVGGKGNSGVGGVLSSQNGTIAYIANSYVKANKFDSALIANAAGEYPAPSTASITAAADAVTSIPSGGTQGISLVDPPASAKDAYPISTFSYIIVPQDAPTAKAAALKKFISWAITTGQSSGPDLDFAPLPSAVVTADTSTLNLIK